MFSIEGKFFKALTKAGDFLILGFLGFVFSIPVITMGASITAMFYVGMKLVRDEEGYVFKGFIRKDAADNTADIKNGRKAERSWTGTVVL